MCICLKLSMVTNSVVDWFMVRSEGGSKGGEVSLRGGDTAESPPPALLVLKWTLE